MKKGVVLIGDLFEETEALVTRNILLRAGMEVSLVSTSGKLVCVSSNGLKVESKYLISEVNAKDFDFVAIAGGAWVSELIKKPSSEQFKAIIDLIQHFAELKKTIAAICAAPVFLAYAGLLDNIEFTCFPGFEKYMQGTYLNVPAVHSNNIVTGHSSGYSHEFALLLLEVLYNLENRKKVECQLGLIK